MKKIFIAALLLIGIIASPLFAQKKLRSKAQLEKAPTYKSIEDANLAKKKVYKLDLDGRRISINTKIFRSFTSEIII